MEIREHAVLIPHRHPRQRAAQSRNPDLLPLLATCTLLDSSANARYLSTWSRTPREKQKPRTRKPLPQRHVPWRQHKIGNYISEPAAMAGNEMDLLKQATQKMMARYEHTITSFAWAGPGEDVAQREERQKLRRSPTPVLEPHTMIRTPKAFVESMLRSCWVFIQGPSNFGAPTSKLTRGVLITIGELHTQKSGQAHLGSFCIIAQEGTKISS